MRQPVRVIHLITELRRGGAEVLLRDLVSHSDRRLFEHKVVTLFAADTPIADDIRRHGVPVIDLGMVSKWRADGLWRLYRLLMEESPEILQGWLYHTNVLVRLFGRMCGVPVVVSAHHSVSTERRHRDLLYRWTRNLDDRAIAVCDAVRRAEIERTGIPEEQIVTIYNGIPEIRFPERAEARFSLLRDLHIPENAPLVGSVGRLSQAKGYDGYVRAIEHITAAHPDAHFVWIGGGEEGDALKALTQRLGLAAKVHMLGDRSDVPRLLAAMDLFVLPSRWEGLPVALLEAMSAGLPVVGTAVGGTPEVVVDGETGFLVPPGDPRALADAVGRMLSDPIRSSEMGRAGRRRVAEKFTVDSMVRQIESLYVSLLEPRWGP